MILDSGLFIAQERARFDMASFRAANPTTAFMSAVTLSELHYGVHRAASEKRRDTRLAFIRLRMAEFPVVAFGTEEAEVHARITAQLDLSGTPIGAMDSLIAASALAHGWSVATLNVSEFQRVPGLKVVDAAPWLVN